MACAATDQLDRRPYSHTQVVSAALQDRALGRGQPGSGVRRVGVAQGSELAVGEVDSGELVAAEDVVIWTTAGRS